MTGVALIYWVVGFGVGLLAGFLWMASYRMGGEK